MRIKIKDIPESGLDWDATFEPSFLEDALEGLEADLAQTRATATLSLHRAGENVFARGHLRGTLAIPCVRCLAPAPMLLDIPLRYTFTPEDELPAEDDVADDVELATHDRQFVVLDDILREALILAVPMNPLCREDCKGLCPVCGQDKNAGDCGHDPRPPDPRFDALKSIKV